MKKSIFLLLLVLGLAFFGCSKEDNSIVGPSTQNNSIVEKPAWLKAAEAQGVQLLTLPPSTEKSLEKRSEVTKYVRYDRWNIVSISNSYKCDNRRVSINASLTIPSNSLNQDTWITMGFVDDYLMSDVNLSFGPDGTEFNKPAFLNIFAYGLDLSGWSQNDDPKLAAYNESTGQWEVVPFQKVYFNVENGSLWCYSQLTHFSRYGFIK
jgi:hypothetical protein